VDFFAATAQVRLDALIIALLDARIIWDARITADELAR
jgi:hypothetical protein